MKTRSPLMDSLRDKRIFGIPTDFLFSSPLFLILLLLFVSVF